MINMQASFIVYTPAWVRIRGGMGLFIELQGED